MTYRYTPTFALRIIQLVILFEAIMRGLMYLLIDKQTTQELSALEQSAPLAVWGGVFIAFGVLGLFGEALMSGTEAYMGSRGNPRAWASFMAHASLMILYVTLSLAYTASITEKGLAFMALVPYDLLMLAYLHWMFARRRKSHVT